MHYLEVVTYGLIAEAGVNEVTLVGDDRGEGFRSIRPIDDWARRGENTLTVRIEWPNLQDAERSQSAQIRARVCLADPNSPAHPRPKAVLAEFSWPNPEFPELEFLPLNVSYPFELPDAPDLRLWTESQQLRGLDSLDKNDIVALVEELRRAIVDGRHDEAYELSAVKFEEDIRANGGDAAQLRATVIEQFGWMTNQPTVISEPVTRSNTDLILCGDDRIVHVARPESLDAFDVIGDEMMASVRVYVAKLNGEWTIVR